MKLNFSRVNKEAWDYKSYDFFSEDRKYNFPKCFYREYTISDILNAVTSVGFCIERFDEYPFQSEDYPCKFILKAKK